MKQADQGSGAGWIGLIATGLLVVMMGLGALGSGCGRMQGLLLTEKQRDAAWPYPASELICPETQEAADVRIDQNR